MIDKIANAITGFSLTILVFLILVWITSPFRDSQFFNLN